MSSVAVNCCSVPQKWPTMPSDVIYTISQPGRQLVVEDNERAAKAEGEATETPQTNGGPVHRNIAPSSGRTPFSVPPIAGYHNDFGHKNCAGDVVDIATRLPFQPKAKLKSFEESSEAFLTDLHNSRFANAEFYGAGRSSTMRSSGDMSEKDDEGEHRGDDITPIRNEMKGKSSMYVQLPQKLQCTDLPPSLQEALVDNHTKRPYEPPSPVKQTNNNKDPDADVEASCAVDCLYYTLQCCDCSIM